MKINRIRPLESNFTEELKTIALVPKMLYFYGKIPELVENMSDDGNWESSDCGTLNLNQNTNVGARAGKRVGKRKAVAIVGARNCTDYGREVAYRTAYELAKAGIVIVSGLAFGIDSVAHRAALDAGGVTVAVLGTEITKIYPKSHEGLAREIVEGGGAVISEYGPEDFAPPKLSFLVRNRLIAGLSEGVLVVEARRRSGSLNTAAHALEQGKNLWAVPGNIDRLSSEGCNRLIAQGAMPYLELKDILEVVMPEVVSKQQKKKPKGESLAENLIIEAIYQGVRNGEEILAKTGLGASEFNVTITLLEVRGVVRGLGANNWMLR